MYINSATYPTTEPIMSEQDVISDSKAIAVANDFIKAYGIATTGLGTPVVDSSWKTSVQESKSRGETPYYPDSVTVTYPVTIDGTTVVDSWSGNPYGLQVYVNSRLGKVTGTGTVSSYAYTGTLRPTIAADDIRSQAENAYGARAEGQTNVTYVDVQLGAPQLVLAPTFPWDEATNTSREILVPTLLFPVLHKPVTDSVYIPDSVSVAVTQ